MDGEKRKVANGCSSADGDTLTDGINSLEKPRQVQYFDVDDDEELAAPKETDGSEDRTKALIEGFQRHRLEMKRWMEEILEKSDLYEAYSRSIAARFPDILSGGNNPLEKPRQLQCFNVDDDEELKIQGLRRDLSEMQRLMEEILEMTERSEAYSRSLVALATELVRELACSQENFNLFCSKADSISFTIKALVSDQTILEDRFRDLEVRMSDMKLKNLKDVSDDFEKDAVINSIKKELKLERANINVAAKKIDDEFVRMENLKKEELEANRMKLVRDKEAEIFLVKERLSQTMVDASMREENLESEIKLLKDKNSELEGKIKEIQYKFDSDVAVQSNMEIDMTDEKTKAKCSKVSWITKAVVAASSGTFAAAVTAFCLHRNR